MRFIRALKLATLSIIANKMRSFLTMLGIIIGVGAVIILVSIMNGVTGQVTELFDSMGANTVSLMIMDRGGTRAVSTKEMYDFVDTHPDLFSGISPNVSINGAKVKPGGSAEHITTNVTGVSEVFNQISIMKLIEGRFIQYFDVEKAQNVCVIGTYIQKELFGGGRALGETIKINGSPFTVVGILEERAGSQAGSVDESIYIPYTYAGRMLGSVFVNAYALLVKDPESRSLAVSKLEDKLRRMLGGDDFFSIISVQEVLDRMNSITAMLSAALVAIAGISLLVGGIGIMNIMLVSVTERTREIGIRKSVGARDGAIMQQFVIEAGTVSGFGGVIGIIFGVLVSLGAGKLLGMNTAPSLSAVAVSFGVSVAIGIIFGFLPAKKAAGLNPIDALRYE